MLFIGKKLINLFFRFLNKTKRRDLIIFSSKKEKKIIDFYEINYLNPQIREIKIVIIKYYLNKIKLNKSFKDHLFNYFYQIEPNIHRKSCIIKYLIDKKFKIDEISASFLIKSDVALFAKFNLKIKKIKPIKINSLISMISLLIFNIALQRKISKTNLKKKSNFNPKIKYSKLLRSKNEHFDYIYENRLKKSFDNTIICLSPYYTSHKTPRDKKYPEFLKAHKRNYFYYNPKINFFYVLQKAIRIYLTSVPHEFKIHLLQIVVQRMRIDDFVNYITKNFPDIQEFYTGYEFYQGLVYLSEKLKALKIKIILFAHGVGIKHNPIANYDLFYVFSKLQKKYYYGTSKFKYYKLNLSLKKKDDYYKKKIALFFICTIFTKFQSYNYNSIYKEAISYIERIAREYKFPVYAKYHPLSTERDKILTKKITIVEKLDDLPQKYKYISITLNSTYAIELLGSMPFLIINPHEKWNINYYLPNDDFIYAKTYHEFKVKIEKFLNNPNYYNEYWDMLISLLKKHYFF